MWHCVQVQAKVRSAIKCKMSETFQCSGYEHRIWGHHTQAVWWQAEGWIALTLCSCVILGRLPLPSLSFCLTLWNSGAWDHGGGARSAGPSAQWVSGMVESLLCPGFVLPYVRGLHQGSTGVLSAPALPVWVGSMGRRAELAATPHCVFLMSAGRRKVQLLLTSPHFVRA